MYLSVCLLDYRKDFQRLAQDGKLLCVHGKLSCLCVEGKALDAYDISYIEQPLEYGIVHGLVFSRADLVALDIYLYPAGRVL